MPAPKEIKESKQLIVEGADAVYFFQALIKHLNITDIQIQNFGGIKELRAFLKALCFAPDFSNLVTSVGIVRDAETNATRAFQSVCDALKAARLAVPQQAITATAGTPQINVLILPDAANQGMLETLCLRTVENDPVMECIEQYFNCVQQRMSESPKNMQKAKIQAFLASRYRPGLRLGEAAKAGLWPWDSPALEHVKQFLQAL